MGIKLTTEEFIYKAKLVHGDKYDYSLVNYNGSGNYVKLICYKHGEFIQKANSLLNGYGCKYCGGNHMTTLDFIEKAELAHGNTYNYSKVNYVNAKTNIIVICKKHGEFIQNARSHLRGNGGCHKCAYNILSNEEFIQKAKKIHGDKYDYSLTKYILNKGIIKILCPIHGKFEQRADVHLNTKFGCKQCSLDNIKSNSTEFIIKAKLIHNDKYDYSKVNYISSKSEVILICAIHGDFNIKPNSHLTKKQGCTNCTSNNPYINKKNDLYNDFIEKSTIIHGNKYNYDKVIYVASRDKVIITCPIHGDFTQTINKHKGGRGCPTCNESIGEREIRKILEKNNIKFEPQKKYVDCKNIKELPFDFYLSDYNTCIEYNGIQHYEPIIHFGGSTKLKLTKKNDKIKMGYCHDNNIPLIIIKYNENILEKLQHLF
jgi:hypothetical protein